MQISTLSIPLTFLTIGNLCSKYCPPPLFKSMTKWTKKAKRNNYNVPKHRKNSSRPWSHKKEENTSLSVIVSYSSMLTPFITWAGQLTVPHQASVHSRLSWESNCHKKMYSCSCHTVPMRRKEIKSVSMHLLEFTIVRRNATYHTVFKECL